MPSLEAGFYSMFLHDDHDGVEKTGIGVAGAIWPMPTPHLQLSRMFLPEAWLTNWNIFRRVSNYWRREKEIIHKGPRSFFIGAAGLTEDDAMSDTKLELYQRTVPNAVHSNRRK